MTSKIPYESLEETINTVELWHNSLTNGDMPDQHGVCELTAKALNFLENLKKVYWTCPYCDRVVAPDEEYITFDATEETVCMDCFTKGI